MLSQRVYDILLKLSKSNVPLWPSEISYTVSDFTDLLDDGYVTQCDKTDPTEKSEKFETYTAYRITPKGLSALQVHNEEFERINTNLKLSRSSRNWAIVAAIISIITLITTILSILLTLLLKI